MKKIYITEQEASQQFGFSRAWFQRKRWDGTGPEYLKVGSKVLYPFDSTVDWLEKSGRKNSTAAHGGDQYHAQK